MRFGIVGQRDIRGKVYEDKAYIYTILDSFSDIDEVITGGSRGVEQLAVEWAKERGKPLRVIPPNIQLHGQQLSFDIRNVEIIQESDVLIVFWDGINRYMSSAIAKATVSGIETHSIPVIDTRRRR